jgi:transposase
MSLEKKDQEQAYLSRVTKNLTQAEQDLKKAEANLLLAKAVKEKATRELADYEQLGVSN